MTAPHSRPGTTSPCPCGSGSTYAQCCGRYLDAHALPATAEQLMRSRYTAYVLHDNDYLLATWHPRTRPAMLDFADAPRWLGLQIKEHVSDGERAEVEFVARYKIGGRAQRLHERSRFEYMERAGQVASPGEGRWLYVDGDLFE